jgi:hypothetical protein
VDKSEQVKKAMAEVYADGFNIYRCLNRLKKDMKLSVDFPPDAIIWTCEAYKQQKPKVREHYPWFVRVFRANSERYFSEQHCRESEERHKARGTGGIPQTLKDILKGMSNG